MNFSNIYQQKEKVLSLEFFPPKSADLLDAVCEQIRELNSLRPHFMTVTYGAGGGTRQFTRQLVSFIHHELKTTAVAHLTCVGHSLSEIDEILDCLAKDGICNVLALRGDPPQDSPTGSKIESAFNHANELTRYIKAHGDFSVAVAGYPEGHPEALSLDSDIDYLKQKIEAGAEAVFTQLFFDSSHYFSFRDRAVKKGIDVPLVPGIMPIASLGQIQRMTARCGATIPERLLKALLPFENDAQGVIEFGIEAAIKLCEELLEGGAPGIHLYTLNKSVQAKPIVEALGICRKE